jgi:hypothetical protein
VDRSARGDNHAYGTSAPSWSRSVRIAPRGRTRTV